MKVMTGGQIVARSQQPKVRVTVLIKKTPPCLVTPLPQPIG